MRLLLLICLATSVGPAHAMLTIQVNYSGPAQFQSFFDDAAATWEGLLQGYQDGSIVAVSSGSSFSGGFEDPLTTVVINASLAPDDGVGGRLGFAGTTETAQDASGFFLATDGIMSFDADDAATLVAGGTFDDLVLHEMGHVLGFGSLWVSNGVFGAPGSGEFLGANATAAWQSEFGQIGTPDVELAGGPGTADGHWNEVDFGVGLTGIQDPLGRDLRDELMTGWLNGDAFVSQMTVNSFIDIGFLGSVIAIPEAGSLLAFGVIFGRLAVASRRR